MNQRQKIMSHLRSVGNISGLEAADLYRVRDLPKRISEIRADAFGEHLLDGSETILGERKQDHLGQRYVRYSLSFSGVVPTHAPQ